MDHSRFGYDGKEIICTPPLVRDDGTDFLLPPPCLLFYYYQHPIHTHNVRHTVFVLPLLCPGTGIFAVGILSPMLVGLRLLDEVYIIKHTDGYVL